MILVDIAKSDKSSCVRAEAVKKIDYPEVLVKLFKNAKEQKTFVN
jgi:hypothetical protein